jgi:hypothetical protein
VVDKKGNKKNVILRPITSRDQEVENVTSSLKDPEAIVT